MNNLIFIRVSREFPQVKDILHGDLFSDHPADSLPVDIKHFCDTGTDGAVSHYRNLNHLSYLPLLRLVHFRYSLMK